MKDLEPDIDPVESQEWQDAIEDVIERDGANRAHFLLDKAVQKARAAGATLPPPDVAHEAGGCSGGPQPRVSQPWPSSARQASGVSTPSRGSAAGSASR